LLERGLMTEEQDTEIRADVERTIEEAVAFAEADDYPDAAALHEGVFA